MDRFFVGALPTLLDVASENDGERPNPADDRRVRSARAETEGAEMLDDGLNRVVPKEDFTR